VRHPTRFLRVALVAAVSAVSACADNTLTSSLAPSDDPSRITNGTPTGSSLYTNVGNLFADIDGDGLWDYRCSGTLVSETVFLTAGHCYEPGATYYISFAATALPAPEPLDESNLISSTTAYLHPEYRFPYYDLAVVILDATEVAQLGISPMPLAPEGYIDALKSGTQWSKQTATVVGYGLASAGRGWRVTQNDGVRRYADIRLVNFNQYWLTLRNNAVNAGRPGSCYGDSGGPVIIGGYLVAVTSFGNDPGCLSVGGYSRVDTEGAIDFLDEFIDY
jgi:V8-like Glu-specific endopeptidase